MFGSRLWEKGAAAVFFFIFTYMCFDKILHQHRPQTAQPSIQTCHGTRGDKGRQSKVIPAQHPDTPWEQGEAKQKTPQPREETKHWCATTTTSTRWRSPPPLVYTTIGTTPPLYTRRALGAHHHYWCTRTGAKGFGSINLCAQRS